MWIINNCIGPVYNIYFPKKKCRKLRASHSDAIWDKLNEDILEEVREAWLESGQGGARHSRISLISDVSTTVTAEGLEPLSLDATLTSRIARRHSEVATQPVSCLDADLPQRCTSEPTIAATMTPTPDGSCSVKHLQSRPPAPHPAAFERSHPSTSAPLISSRLSRRSIDSSSDGRMTDEDSAHCSPQNTEKNHSLADATLETLHSLALARRARSTDDHVARRALRRPDARTCQDDRTRTDRHEDEARHKFSLHIEGTLVSAHGDLASSRQRQAQTRHSTGGILVRGASEGRVSNSPRKRVRFGHREYFDWAHYIKHPGNSTF
eukprot:GEMP01035572.1.p1 GENE.GEMP01035572.1~~GEMP01035572.1.p1  ORF type:complete len:323 (+),score=52.26 GEMP01035572.1:333-1301(+)